MSATVTIDGIAAYIPRGRLTATTVAAAWGRGPGRGARSVASYDEDALTLAAAAAATVLDSNERPSSVWFASTSSPYLEKQIAAVLAAAVDAPRSALTVDVSSSLRGFTTAMRAAAAVLPEHGGTAVVTAGDVRLAAADSPEELRSGDAGGAAELRLDGEGAEIVAMATVNDNTLVSWRLARDPHIQSGDLRFGLQYGIVAPAVEAAQAVLESAGLEATDIDHLAIAASQPQAAAAIARAIGTDATVTESHVSEIGFLGAASAAFLLAQALVVAAPGSLVLLLVPGDGADALLVRAGAKPPRGAASASEAFAGAVDVRGYATYLRRRGIVANEASAPPPSSPITQRREEATYLRFHGARCRTCGQLQHPITPLCSRCASSDLEEQRLSRNGTIFTFTTDFIVAGVNPGLGESPVTMAVIDLDDGARVFVQLTDFDEADIEIGLRVELVLRLLHTGSGYNNYYWKARTAPNVAGEG